jgi:hypothetical protein
MANVSVFIQGDTGLAKVFGSTHKTRTNVTVLPEKGNALSLALQRARGTEPIVVLQKGTKPRATPAQIGAALDKLTTTGRSGAPSISFLAGDSAKAVYLNASAVGALKKKAFTSRLVVPTRADDDVPEMSSSPLVGDSDVLTAEGVVGSLNDTTMEDIGMIGMGTTMNGGEFTMDELIVPVAGAQALNQLNIEGIITEWIKEGELVKITIAPLFIETTVTESDGTTVTASSATEGGMQAVTDAVVSNMLFTQSSSPDTDNFTFQGSPVSQETDDKMSWYTPDQELSALASIQASSGMSSMTADPMGQLIDFEATMTSSSPATSSTSTSDSSSTMAAYNNNRNTKQTNSAGGQSSACETRGLSSMWWIGIVLAVLFCIVLLFIVMFRTPRMAGFRKTGSSRR